MTSLRVFMCISLLGFVSCRDEQAGPRRKPTRSAVKTLDTVPMGLPYRQGATWADGAVEYLGSRWEPASPSPGQVVQVSHYFRALRAPPPGFQFFVHLLASETGQMVLNLDHEPQDGMAPLDSWPLGKVIEDTHRFNMPDSGPVRLVMGFWKGDGRLSIDTSAANDGQQRVLGPVLGQLPEYTARRTGVAPKIDGLLDDAAWKTADAVVLVGSFDGRPTESKTTARLTYDDAFLYVAFDSEDADIWGTLRGRDDAIYNEEVVEVFLDANGDGRTYNELQVSPHNVQFDAAFEARRKDLEGAKRWTSGMKSAVKVFGTLDNAADRDERWQVEMAIPFKSLMEVPSVPPGPNDIWRFNLYRLDHPMRQRVEGQAFSPLFVGDFHHLPRFARLRFQ